jgi:hypothetical protein
LWYVAGDLVVIAFVGRKDVDVDMRAGGFVEGAHGDAGPIAFDWIPEE